MWRKTNKYGAKRCTYRGVIYHSKKEASYAMELEYKKIGGVIKDWKRQIKIPLTVNNILIANYVVDFVVEHNDGTLEYVEVKGVKTPTWKLKWKLFEALYPELKKTIT